MKGFQSLTSCLRGSIRRPMSPACWLEQCGFWTLGRCGAAADAPNSVPSHSRLWIPLHDTTAPMPSFRRFILTHASSETSEDSVTPLGLFRLERYIRLIKVSTTSFFFFVKQFLRTSFGFFLAFSTGKLQLMLMCQLKLFFEDHCLLRTPYSEPRTRSLEPIVYKSGVLLFKCEHCSGDGQRSPAASPIEETGANGLACYHKQVCMLRLWGFRVWDVKSWA